MLMACMLLRAGLSAGRAEDKTWRSSMSLAPLP